MVPLPWFGRRVLHLTIMAYSDAGTPRLSLEPIARALTDMLHRNVTFIGNCVGASVVAQCVRPKTGSIMLLEKLLSNNELQKMHAMDLPAYYQVFAEMADIFINDVFATVHTHDSATMLGAGFSLKTYGLQIAKELDAFNKVCVSFPPISITKNFVCLLWVIGARVCD